jgi:hypothetical protein
MVFPFFLQCCNEIFDGHGLELYRMVRFNSTHVVRLSPGSASNYLDHDSRRPNCFLWSGHPVLGCLDHSARIISVNRVVLFVPKDQLDEYEDLEFSFACLDHCERSYATVTVEKSPFHQ